MEPIIQLYGIVNSDTLEPSTSSFLQTLVRNSLFSARITIFVTIICLEQYFIASKQKRHKFKKSAVF